MTSLITADAILLVGHGTRNEFGQQQFLKLAEHLRAAVAPLPVEPAYIELQSPTIQDALVSLHQRGHKTILLSPGLLFAAGHAKQDIPAAVELAKQQCPDLVVTPADPLGCHEAVLKLATIRFQNSLAPVLREGRGEGPDPRPDFKTALVLIGRGSSDQSAIAHCQNFATQLAQRLGVTQVFTGFIAMAEPTITVALKQAAASDARQIIVQPHLLFTGDMLESTSSAVSAAKQTHPQIDWRQAEVLGADLLVPDSHAATYLVQALLTRIIETSQS
jgi:sirohydrochlorin cobaltochelatase